ncbi:MAG: S8 family serine peptidase [Bacteroidales bacterium]
MNKTGLIFIGFILLTSFGNAQNDTSEIFNENNNIYHNWYNKSPIEDEIFGAEVDKAYAELLHNKKSTTIVVAVIDGGMDIHHEDLKDNIWVNPNEIPNNNIDDDNNGYIDDMHGWNFLGNSAGENIANENLEVTRIYRNYKDRFENLDPRSISDIEKPLYETYQKAKKIYFEKLNEAKDTKKQLETFRDNYETSKNEVSSYHETDSLIISDLSNFKSDDKDLMKHVSFLKFLYSNGFTEDALEEMEDHNNEELDYHLNLDFQPRQIIGDNPTDISENYGNNNVYGPKAEHGTFVAGIIGAVRNNDLGINGVASDVKIMAIKTVPNGDERDKDVAKAIRYAVDNGARIINMSFGKDISPQKYLVDDAIKYAQENDVLMIHAAGNEALNNDKVPHYPTKFVDHKTEMETWITVGASAIKGDMEFAAIFSNYGRKTVDLFAPGVDVKSLLPEDHYDILSGTSFSSPVVAGVAALILSYYPELSAREVKEIILSSTNQYPRTKVYKPGFKKNKRKKTRFKKLSSTAGIVSAYKAIQLAEEKYQ